MPQTGTFRFKDTVTGKSYQMPWSGTTPPSDDDIDRYIKSTETPKIQAPLVSTQPITPNLKWGDYTAMALRGLSGLAVGSVPGAIASGAAEIPAQLFERYGGTRKEFDPKQIAIEAGIGAIPFGKAAKTLRTVRAIGKGAAVSGGGEAIREVINEDKIDPARIGTAAVLGGAAGGALERLTRKVPVVKPTVVKPPNPRIRAITEKLTPEEIYTANPKIDPNMNQGIGNPELAGSYVQPKAPLSKTDLINAETIKQVSDMRTVPKKTLTPEEEILQALKGAKPLRNKQEKMYSEERAKRFAESKRIGETTSGMEGFKKELSALGGQLPKAQFTPVKLKPESIDYLYDKIKNSTSLNQETFEPIRARVALSKLIGEHGGTVPQENELELLGRVFGEDFITRVQKLKPFSSQAKTILAKALGTTKAARATLDLSFPLRQGVFYIGNKEFWKAVKPMVTDAFSTKNFEARQQALRTRPNAGLAQKSGLDLSDLHTKREEQFVNNYLENIPGIKHLVKGSNRAYVSFGNQLRSGVFDGMIENLKKSGKGVDPREAELIAKFINTTTGRGGLGSLEKIGGELNTALFSPRLASSRLQMVFRPSIYVKGSSEIRKQSLKSLLSLSSFLGSALALSKMAGADVSVNPNDSDFGKIKVDNTRVDLGGGLLQPLRLASQLISGEYVRQGKERQLGDTYVAPTRLSLLGNYGINKASPFGAFLLNILRGKTSIGEELTAAGELESLFVPMIVQDFKELMQEDPELLPLGLPAIFGASVQVYPSKKSGLQGVSKIR